MYVQGRGRPVLFPTGLTFGLTRQPCFQRHMSHAGMSRTCETAEVAPSAPSDRADRRGASTGPDAAGSGHSAARGRGARPGLPQLTLRRTSKGVDLAHGGATLVHARRGTRPRDAAAFSTRLDAAAAGAPSNVQSSKSWLSEKGRRHDRRRAAGRCADADRAGPGRDGRRAGRPCNGSPTGPHVRPRRPRSRRARVRRRPLLRALFRERSPRSPSTRRGSAASCRPC
jgi:hypothetical protein